MTIEIYHGFLHRTYQVLGNFSDVTSKTIQTFCQLSKNHGIPKNYNECFLNRYFLPVFAEGPSAKYDLLITLTLQSGEHLQWRRPILQVGQYSYL
jgi:hypothetical protein